MQQLVSVQHLRAVAAMMVVVYHARLHLDRMGLPAAGTDWLASRVDVFFVISGLIMWVSTAVLPVGTLAFWWRHAVQIVPLPWLLTSVLVVVSLLAPGLLRTARFDLAHTAASLRFLPWTHPVMGEPMPVLAPGWPLNHEMGFYLLFRLALVLSARLRF